MKIILSLIIVLFFVSISNAAISSFSMDELKKLGYVTDGEIQQYKNWTPDQQAAFQKAFLLNSSAAQKVEAYNKQMEEVSNQMMDTQSYKNTMTLSGLMTGLGANKGIQALRNFFFAILVVPLTFFLMAELKKIKDNPLHIISTVMQLFFTLTIVYYGQDIIYLCATACDHFGDLITPQNAGIDNLLGKWMAYNNPASEGRLWDVIAFYCSKAGWVYTIAYFVTLVAQFVKLLLENTRIVTLGFFMVIYPLAGVCSLVPAWRQTASKVSAGFFALCCWPIYIAINDAIFNIFIGDTPVNYGQVFNQIITCCTYFTTLMAIPTLAQYWTMMSVHSSVWGMASAAANSGGLTRLLTSSGTSNSYLGGKLLKAFGK